MVLNVNVSFGLVSSVSYVVMHPVLNILIIGRPLFPKPMNLDEAREAFLSFFDKHSHTRR